MSESFISSNYFSAVPSIPALTARILLHFGKTKKLGDLLATSTGGERDLQAMARLLEQRGGELISRGSHYNFDDLRKAVNGKPVLESALAQAMGKALPQILDQGDYQRFIFIAEKAQLGEIYKDHVSSGLLLNAAKKMLDEGYPAYYQKIKRLMPDLALVKAMEDQYEFITVDSDKLRSIEHPRLVLMFEKCAGPVVGRSFCQLGVIGGMTPAELVQDVRSRQEPVMAQYLRENNRPDQADELKLVLKNAMEGRLQRKRTIIVDEQETLVPTLDAPAILRALQSLEMQS